MTTLRPDIQARLASAAVKCGMHGLEVAEVLSGGRNNVTLRVQVAGIPILAKIYPLVRGDERDRLSAELAFLEYAGAACGGFVPDIVDADRASGVLFAEWIDGQRVTAETLQRADIDTALEFFAALQVHAQGSAGRALSPASEACLDWDSHLTCVDLRMDRLSSVEDQEVADFLRETLSPCWLRLRRGLEELEAAAHFRARVSPRCISPSDFGFHNALRDDSGCLRFVDFEYAGWDDPAKMAADFCAQVEVPVAPVHHAAIRRQVLEIGATDSIDAQRMEVLALVHRLKWCCLVLNEFDPVAFSRRRHSLGAVQAAGRRPGQLQLARRLSVALQADIEDRF